MLHKDLSRESLVLSDLPTDRNYFVFPEEEHKAVHFHRRHFFKDVETRPESPLPSEFELAEQKLRTIYRSGHLEEIKKAQVRIFISDHKFGKAYLAIRKLYSDAGRDRALVLKKSDAVNAYDF